LFREEFDDWAILFDPDTSDAFGLNPVSAFIWKRLDGKSTIAEIVRGLGKECEDMPEDAMGHVKRFVDELIEKGYAGYEE
jgi:SynChlorMet cassette protein ScmD